ncbi:MAG TPA: CocE/NonD family hydrolase, partial [Candidatus Thermoplasmatota archaeon]
DKTGPGSRPLLNGTLDIGDGEVTILKSELDGVDIEIAVVRPVVPAGTKVPIIGQASPYFSIMTADNVKAQGSWLVSQFVPHGYAYAAISARGTAGSGGCMDLFGPKERVDLDQAVTWLGTQDWSNGNVALIGISYDGSTPWQVAALGNPYLKTIVPVEGITDYFRLNFRNGTFNSFGAGGEMVYYLPGIEPERLDLTAADINCPEMRLAAQSLEYSTVTGTHDPWGFWAARDVTQLVLENYRGSVFVAQGFRDDNVDPAMVTPLVNRLEERGAAVKQLWGQWYHSWADGAAGAGKRWDWHEMLLHWFDYWLKEDHTVDLGPQAHVQDSSEKWRQEESWPPNDSNPVAFELSFDGRLTTEGDARSGSLPVSMSVPQNGGGSTTGDPYNWADLICPQCPTFLTPAFESDFRFAGQPTVHMTVTPRGPGGYVAAHLFSVDAQGSAAQVLGMGGGIRLAFADGSLTPKPVTPGQPLLAKLELMPMDAVVPSGHRLMLVVHQGGFESQMPPPDPGVVSVDLGGGKSVLTVRAFERGEDAFFLPP